MGQQVALLVLGFLLTTVLGGGFAYIFQARAWRHQHNVQRRDDQRAQGFKAFEEISTRLDTRLFRMRRVYWAGVQLVQGTGGESKRHEELEKSRAEYRAVLYEWNDNLNRTFALVDTYFGGAVRQQLDLRGHVKVPSYGHEKVPTPRR